MAKELKNKLPVTVKVGMTKYKVQLDEDDTILQGDSGCCYGIPPRIFIDAKEPNKGTVLFEEVGHAVEKELRLEVFGNNEGHSAFFYMFFLALQQNGYLATCLRIMNTGG